jgi:pimeloyl-ACP methyl ester carboxylesterase
MRVRGKHVLFATALAVAVVLVAVPLAYGPTLAFLMDIAGYRGAGRALLPSAALAVTTQDVPAPTRYGPITTRIYTPIARPTHTVIVVPGVHGGGVDEPRLATFCGRLASTGVQVVCTPLPELRDFRITGRSTDMIEDVAMWTIRDPGRVPSGRVTLVGVSFGGGLALVAAGRPSLRDHLEMVLSVGGYGDLPRTLRYMCTGELPDGSRRPPHDYGPAVLALAAVRRLVPPDQADALEHGIRVYLEASLDDTPEKTRAAALLAEARDEAAALPEPARGVLTAVTERQVERLGQLLLPLVEDLAHDPALSPERSPITQAPVFLIHGIEDNVIPSSETPLMAADLVRRGHRPVDWLLTPLLSHADLSIHATAGDAYRLITFWHRVLGVLG